MKGNEGWIRETQRRMVQDMSEMAQPAREEALQRGRLFLDRDGPEGFVSAEPYVYTGVDPWAEWRDYGGEG